MSVFFRFRDAGAGPTRTFDPRSDGETVRSPDCLTEGECVIREQLVNKSYIL